MKEDKGMIIAIIIALIAASFIGCVRVDDCDRIEYDVYVNRIYSHTEVETICYY